MHKFFLIITIAILMPATLFAKELHVTTIERDPFVKISENGEYSGFSVDLWRAIAEDRGWEYVFEPVDTFIELLRAPRNKTSDLAIANISITADRKEVMDFSSSIFDSGLQIITTKQKTFTQFFTALLSRQIFYIIITIAAIFLVLSFIIWLFERKINEEEAGKYSPNIFQTMWQSWTWGSFGRDFPITKLGRAALICWMILQIIAISFFTASLTAVMTAQNMTESINSYHDLRGKKIGVTTGSTSEAFLRKNNIEGIQYDDINKLFADVARGAIDAAVHDAPLVQYFATHRGSGRVTLVPDIFNKESYGIALPINSPLREEIDLALLHLQENGTYQKIYDKWFNAK